MVDQRQIWDSLATSWSSRWDSADGQFFRMRADVAVQLITHRIARGEALDYGCGDGYLVGRLQAVGLQAYGCDISPAMVAEAQTKLAPLGLPKDRVVVCDGCEIPFSKQFAVVFILGVYPYFRNYWDFTQQLHGSLILGGYVVANCTNRFSLFTAKAILLNIAEFRPSNWKAWLGTFVALAKTGIWSGGGFRPNDRNVRQCYSAGSFDRLFSECGFGKVAEVDLYHLTMLDRSPLNRSSIAKILARRLAWNHIGIYQRLPKA